jgi:alpha-glucosidase
LDIDLRQLLAVLVALTALGAAQAAPKHCVDSPGKVLEVCISTSGGSAFYEVRREGRPVLERAVLGIVFAGEKVPQVNRITGSERHSHDETWEQPWGEQRVILDRHNELRIKLHGDTPNSDAFDVVIRAFDDGFAYVITERTVTAADRLALALAPGGGAAIRFKALD